MSQSSRAQCQLGSGVAQSLVGLGVLLCFPSYQNDNGIISSIRPLSHQKGLALLKQSPHAAAVPERSAALFIKGSDVGYWRWILCLWDSTPFLLQPVVSLPEFTTGTARASLRKGARLEQKGTNPAGAKTRA